MFNSFTKSFIQITQSVINKPIPTISFLLLLGVNKTLANNDNPLDMISSSGTSNGNETYNSGTIFLIVIAGLTGAAVIGRLAQHCWREFRPRRHPENATLITTDPSCVEKLKGVVFRCLSDATEITCCTLRNL